MSKLRIGLFPTTLIWRERGADSNSRAAPPLRSLGRLVGRWRRRARLREEGRRLADRQGRLLRDVGLSRGDFRELAQGTAVPFWP